ncbi:hypothetical protein [Lysobacter gummosus]|uniref:hypothetical protein n=1 Tax=Lysobacter gummosus TaxID=262324 RepID=UPI0036265C62
MPVKSKAISCACAAKGSDASASAKNRAVPDVMQPPYFPLASPRAAPGSFSRSWR